MVQNKYLITVVFFLSLSQYAQGSSWLPGNGKSIYTISLSHIDNQSKKLKTKRADCCYEIYLKMIDLYKKKHILTAYHGLEESSPKLAQINAAIAECKKHIEILSSYQNHKYGSASIELGISDYQSLGVIAFYNQNYFVSNEMHYKSKFDNHSAILFTKLKLFHCEKFAGSFKASFTKNINKYDNDVVAISMALGRNQPIKSLEFVSDCSISLGKSLHSKKFYYSFSLSESIKLPRNFMFTLFLQDTIRIGYCSSYFKTRYQQISIAKSFIFGNLSDNLTLQLGYFRDTSLLYKAIKLRNSGIVTSLWIEV
ncbi:MAG: hypothetical protein AB8B67_01795 [Rickettsiaceae bacterium]